MNSKFFIIAGLALLILLAGCLEPTLDDGTINSEDCASITDSKEKDSCFNKQALTANNFTLCDNVSDTKTKDSCYGKIAGIVFSEEACGKISTDKDETNCYRSVALNASLTELREVVCDNIKVKIDSEKCNYDLAAKYVDNAKKSCEKELADKALNKKDEKYASELADCQTRIKAERVPKSESVCGRIDTDETRDNCYANLGKVSSTSTVCSKVV
ncbi:MAG: hypothetical protein Q7K42_00635, partial [Candidatus Diapherotrites archaeon]|nr:hypothetical protein [Candidatus Diapherotrites archaeon]